MTDKPNAAPVEVGDRERARHYLRAGGPHDAANSTEEAANLLAIEFAAAFKRGQEKMRGEALWSVKTPVPSGNGDYQLGFLHGQRVAQRAIRALPVEESK